MSVTSAVEGRRRFLRNSALAAGVPLLAPFLGGCARTQNDAEPMDTAPGHRGTNSGEPNPLPTRLSLPGTYRGYSSAVADGFTRSSRYVAVSDGTRLAHDLYRPTLAGESLHGPLPLVAISTGYRRAWITSDGESRLVRLK